MSDAGESGRLGWHALESGLPALAYEMFTAGLQRDPEHRRLRYGAALALARLGSIGAARNLLDPLLKQLDSEDQLYADAYSLAGRLGKDAWTRLADSEARGKAAEESAALYLDAYKASNGYFPGINAATMKLACGQREEADALAREVYARCEALRTQGDASHWLEATLGEASLLSGRVETARTWYARAVRSAGSRYGDLASMRRQLRILAQLLRLESSIVDVVTVPRIVAFAGHMTDAPDAPRPRFPAELEAPVAAELAAILERLNAGVGFACPASGADILFIEAMLARGADVHVVLPFEREEFVETCVAIAGARWVRRFAAALDHARSVTCVTEEGWLGDDTLFSYANNVIAGTALLRAKVLEAEAVFLAVADPAGERRPGGTLDALHAWQSRGLKTEMLDIRRLRAGLLADGDEAVPVPPPASGTRKREVRAMLFGDVVGFSRLREHAAPSFFAHFLGEMAKVIEKCPQRPLHANTWGDGLYLAFHDVEGAAECALRLREAVLGRRWEEVGLPRGMSMRIGMHAGPVFAGVDPVISRDTVFGSHVTRAARIEPIATPGSVLMSEPTACLLAASGNPAYESDYLGEIDLAKGYGSGVLYRLRRAGEIE